MSYVIFVTGYYKSDKTRSLVPVPSMLMSPQQDSARKDCTRKRQTLKPQPVFSMEALLSLSLVSGPRRQCQQHKILGQDHLVTSPHGLDQNTTDPKTPSLVSHWRYLPSKHKHFHRSSFITIIFIVCNNYNFHFYLYI